MKVKINIAGDVATAALEGDIDEDVERVMDEITKGVKSKTLVFDCAAVRKINSIGVKGWITGLTKLQAGHQISFAKCPQAFLDMAVMVPNFTRRQPITSFFATWGCVECAREKSMLIEIRGGEAKLPTTLVCEKCGGRLKADDDLKLDLDYVLGGGDADD